MDDEIDNAKPLKYKDSFLAHGSIQLHRMKDLIDSQNQLFEDIIEWFFNNNYSDTDYVIMGSEIIIKDPKVRMHFKMVWGEHFE